MNQLFKKYFILIKNKTDQCTFEVDTKINIPLAHSRSILHCLFELETKTRCSDIISENRSVLLNNTMSALWAREGKSLLLISLDFQVDSNTARGTHDDQVLIHTRSWHHLHEVATGSMATGSMTTGSPAWISNQRPRL